MIIHTQKLICCSSDSQSHQVFSAQHQAGALRLSMWSDRSACTTHRSWGSLLIITRECLFTAPCWLGYGPELYRIAEVGKVCSRPLLSRTPFFLTQTTSSRKDTLMLCEAGAEERCQPYNTAAGPSSVWFLKRHRSVTHLQLGWSCRTNLPALGGSAHFIRDRPDL